MTGTSLPGCHVTQSVFSLKSSQSKNLKMHRSATKMMKLHSMSSHACDIKNNIKSKSCLPRLPPDAGCLEKLKRRIKKWTLISESNPRCCLFYRSFLEIYRFRKEQISSKSWIIHPFSMFRWCFHNEWEKL